MKNNLRLKFVKSIDVILVAIPLIVVWIMYYNQTTKVPYGWKGNIVLFLIYVILYFSFGKIYNAFSLNTSNVSDIIFSQILGFLLADGLFYLIIFLLAGKFPNIIPGLICILVQAILTLIYSLLAYKWYLKVFPAIKAIVVYDVKDSINDLVKEYGLENRYNIKDTLNVKKVINNLDILKDVEAIFITDLDSHDRNVILKYCINNSIMVYVLPKLGDIIMSGAKDLHLFHLPILQVTRYAAQPEYLAIKRFFDIVLSLCALIILSPLLLITALAIKLNDGGPILYRQVRLTKDGKEFEILKFRSMRTDAEKDGRARLSTGENDDRITSVGKFIRKCRIDELPQLLNILKGDLSIVGPRPERPEIAREYEKVLPEFNLRLQAKAGLTGYAQVYGKYNTSPYNKLQMDLMYIAKPSIIEDFKIILATIKILFIKESTEGLEVGKTNAID